MKNIDQLVVVLLISIFALTRSDVAMGNVVFNVQHKFGGRGNVVGTSNLTALMAHDFHRQRRMLADIDFQLGGNGLIMDNALYYMKFSIGSPPQDYYVQVDTGSSIMWVNCAGCDECPRKSSLGIKLTWYDLKASSSGKPVTCDQDLCASVLPRPPLNCTVGSDCPCSLTYVDQCQTSGYFVQDSFQFDRISGDLQTSYMNGSIVFGCSTKLSGRYLDHYTDAVDGIVGLGRENSSIISQLALSGKTRKIFSHCLDNVKGGGISAIGEVVEPIVNTTRMVPNQRDYIAILKYIEVGGSALEAEGTSVVLDSGSTLAYIRDDLYDALMVKVMSQQPGLETRTVQLFTCFYYHKNVDDGFPVVSFQFEGSASLNAYPHDYLFGFHKDEWCIGWRRSFMNKDVTLLGDIVLSNKLIVYNQEDQTIGFTEHNCSSSIKVKDEASGNAYLGAAHNISLACSLCLGKGFIFIFLMMLWNLKLN